MGRPLPLSAGSLRAAAAQGDPAIGSPGNLGAGETGREACGLGPAAAFTAATRAATRILTPSAGNTDRAASSEARYSGSLAGA